MARSKTALDPNYEGPMPKLRDKIRARMSTPATTTTTTTSTTAKKGLMAGYTGPKVGTPEWKAARKAGQHPIMDYLKSEMAKRKAARQANRPANRPSYNTGIVPPNMGGSPVPRPAVTKRAPVKATVASTPKRSPAAAMSLMSRKPTLITKKR